MYTRTLLLVCSLSLAAASAFAKEEFATAKEAEAMVKMAVDGIKANKQKTLDEINSKDAKWVDRDLYAVVYDMNGKVAAHGANPKLVGKDLIEIKDADGKAFVKERVELAKSKGKFWQDYRFTDPLTRKLLAKTAYCEKVEDLIACAGIYKR